MSDYIIPLDALNQQTTTTITTSTTTRVVAAMLTATSTAHLLTSSTAPARMLNSSPASVEVRYAHPQLGSFSVALPVWAIALLAVVFAICIAVTALLAAFCYKSKTKASARKSLMHEIFNRVTVAPRVPNECSVENSLNSAEANSCSTHQCSSSTNIESSGLGLSNTLAPTAPTRSLILSAAEAQPSQPVSNPVISIVSNSQATSHQPPPLSIALSSINEHRMTTRGMTRAINQER